MNNNSNQNTQIQETQEQPIKPLINDAYWFNWSKNCIDNVSSVSTDAAIKIKDLILWLWGLYLRV